MQHNDLGFEITQRLTRHQERCGRIFWEGYHEKMAAFSPSSVRHRYNDERATLPAEQGSTVGEGPTGVDVEPQPMQQPVEASTSSLFKQSMFEDEEEYYPDEERLWSSLSWRDKLPFILGGAGIGAAGIGGLHAANAPSGSRLGAGLMGAGLGGLVGGGLGAAIQGEYPLTRQEQEDFYREQGLTHEDVFGKTANMQSFDMTAFSNQQAAQMPTNLQNGAPTPDAMALPTQPGAPTTLSNAPGMRPASGGAPQPTHMTSGATKASADYNLLPHQAREIIGGSMKPQDIQRAALKASMAEVENKAAKDMMDENRHDLASSESL